MHDPVRIAIEIIYSTTLILFSILTFAFFYSQIKKRGWMKFLANRFLMAIVALDFGQKLYLITAFLLIDCTNYSPRVILLLNVLFSLSIQIMIISHIFCLYLRSDAVIIGTNAVKLVRFLIFGAVITSTLQIIFTGFAKTDETWGTTCVWAASEVNILIIVAALFVPTLDIIYGYNFVKYMRRSANGGSRKESLQDIIALEGIKVTITVLLGVTLYSVAFTLKFANLEKAAHYTSIFIPQFFAVSILLWIRMKIKMDKFWDDKNPKENEILVERSNHSDQPSEEC